MYDGRTRPWASQPRTVLAMKSGPLSLRIPFDAYRVRATRSGYAPAAREVAIGEAGQTVRIDMDKD